jgi:hypothetical protein
MMTSLLRVVAVAGVLVSCVTGLELLPTSNECKFLSPRCKTFEGIDFRTIPYTVDRVLSTFTSISNLFDDTKMRQCLKDRYVVFLGDSTVSERILDMTMTMGGISKNETALNQFISSPEIGVDWIHHPHHDFNDKSLNDSSYHHFNDVTLAYHAWNHRNMTITLASERMKIRYRFNGHYLIHSRFLGISAMTHPSIEQELAYMFGYDELAANMNLNNQQRPTYNRVPNAIVIHSGYHDYWNKEHKVEIFRKTLLTIVINSLVRYHRANLAVIPPIYWQGTPLHYSKYTSVETLRQIDEAAFALSQLLPNLVYINTTRVYDYIPDLEANLDLYTNDFIHFGAVNRHHFPSKLGTISVLMTNYVLTYICATDNYVNNVKSNSPTFPMPEPTSKANALSVGAVLDYHTNWMNFVGTARVTQSGQLACLVIGRVFPCPATSEELKRFTGLTHERTKTMDESLLRLFSPIQNMSPLVNNSLIRASNEKQIYWILNGEKIPIRHGRVFFNRGWEFDQVVAVDAECLELFRTGTAIEN